MYLKRLELIGFKSFASKTVLEFPAGITAVVGPNGSGKSNIIDAIRWLLGEREAKNMRSLKAEDLIFSGTPEKSRLSLAQAIMVFDNASHFFPFDFEEITVRRRIERDGTSNYYLNDAEVRLKDIVDFFAKSRLGTRGFSVINQGDSDLFVRSSPKERRSMLEEILGLRQYQIKKHEAELKLKNTKTNMESVRALVDEIMPHLKILRRQTAKWEKHGDLKKELEDLEQQYFGSKIQEIETERVRLEPRIKESDVLIESLEKELKTRETELKKVDSAADWKIRYDENFKRWQKERGHLFDRKAGLEKEIGKLEAQIEMFNNQPETQFDSSELVRLLEEARETIEDILPETNLRVIKDLLKSLFEKINAVFEDETKLDFKVRRSDINQTQDKVFNELKEIEAQLAVINRREQNFNLEIKDFNEVFKKAYQSVEAKKDEISEILNQKNKILFEVERVNLKREELARQASQIGRKLDEFKDIKPEVALDLAQAERRLLRLRSELSGIGEIDTALIKEAEETEARYQFLSSQLADLEGASQDLSSLLKELEKKIHDDFARALHSINEAFHNYFRLMFGGGRAKLILEKKEPEKNITSENSDAGMASSGFRGEGLKEDDVRESHGIEISVAIPSKRITSLDMLSGGEKSLVSMAVLFALISVSPPPFLVLDEADAALDEVNSRRFAELVREFSKQTQFLFVTHNRTTMEAADILYGITMADDGTSKVLSLKLA